MRMKLIQHFEDKITIYICSPLKVTILAPSPVHRWWLFCGCDMLLEYSPSPQTFQVYEFHHHHFSSKIAIYHTLFIYWSEPYWPNLLPIWPHRAQPCDWYSHVIYIKLHFIFLGKRYTTTSRWNNMRIWLYLVPWNRLRLCMLVDAFESRFL